MSFTYLFPRIFVHHPTGGLLRDLGKFGVEKPRERSELIMTAGHSMVWYIPYLWWKLLHTTILLLLLLCGIVSYSPYIPYFSSTFFLVSRHVPFVYFTLSLFLHNITPYGSYMLLLCTCFESLKSSFDLILSSNASLFTLGNPGSWTPVWEKTASQQTPKR